MIHEQAGGIKNIRYFSDHIKIIRETNQLSGQCPNQCKHRMIFCLDWSGHIVQQY